MAPQKASKPVKAGGADIRAFFGGSQNQSTPAETKTSTQASQMSEVIDISDDEKPSSKLKPKSKETSKLSHSMDISDDEAPSRRHTAAPSLKRKKPAALMSSDEEDEEVKKLSPPKKKPAVTAAASSSKPSAASSSSKSKRSPEKSKPKPVTKSKKDSKYDIIVDDNDEDDDFIVDDDDDDLMPKKQSKGRAAAKKKNAKEKKTPSKSEDKPRTNGNDSSKSFNWAAKKAAQLAGPVAPGSKEVPNGEPDCLAGLAFVFTGELTSFSRDEVVDLAKRFGGRVVGQPSSKTNYVVLGDNAGPSKLAAIKKHGLSTLNEDEFLNLIKTRKVKPSDMDEKTRKKREKDEEAIRLGAKELEKREKGKGKDAGGRGLKSVDSSSQLWTTRYAPQSLKEICGNKGQVEKLQSWLHDWPQNVKSEFKKPGKHGMNIFRAVLITGAPGIGKTTSAHLCAKLEGFTVIELNASDARSKTLVENGMNINNTSLDGWMGGEHHTNAAGIQITDRSCIIMDEVDGMSAGDRGGVGALNALIKKTKVPIICIANDRGAQKLKPLMSTTFSLTFRKPEAAAIRSRILSIVYKEKMNVPSNVIDQLVTGAQSDIRQVLNMLSTWKLSSDSMDFDEGKSLAKMNEKYSMMSPFDITNKMLGPYMFSPTARETLNDKMELYFHDHSFVPLFIQENYLKTQPAKVRVVDGPLKTLTQLDLMDKAASSISDGDLVDALIHGPEQHWGLMPLHAVCSTVRPASFLYGASGGYGGPNAMTFPAWLGQNSKQNKLSRQLGDVQIRMRLKVSGDKSEIRQSYLPALFPHIVRPLIDVGASAVGDVIERMDEYYLSREDWDTVVELGVDQNKDDLILKKISTATKTSFTKKYNSGDHPIPYHKAQDLGKIPKKLAGGPAPDLEEAFDFDEDVPDDNSDDEKKTKKKGDFGGDKLIKAAKANKGASSKSQAKGKGKQ